MNGQIDRYSGLMTHRQTDRYGGWMARWMMDGLLGRWVDRFLGLDGQIHMIDRWIRGWMARLIDIQD